ncbi:MAG: ABC transporter substrate-binding protein [Terracoccus sp.]
MNRPRLALAVVSVVAFAALGACGSTTPAGPTVAATGSGAGASADACAKASLPLVTSGKLTVGTDKPAYEPWFSKDDPSNGKGYESAVAFAAAEKMGFAKADVTWVVVPFNTAISPAAKTFDLDVNQISISDARKKAVDFSSGYYDVRQAVVTYKGSPLDGKTTVADLKGANLAAQVGTTSYDAIKNQIQPSNDPKIFDTNDLAVQALKNKQIDGIVVDVPTAFYMIGAQLDNGVIVGQLPDAGGKPEQFGAVLDKGSALTPCVSKAIDALRSDGTLDKLQKEYLANAGAPELK